jgi:spore maturation protein CgeB
VFPYRVTPLTADERTQLYRRAKIGFNMHVSEVPTESGNMRMYELPSYGVMQVCDKAGRDAHATIFAPGREAVFYDDMKDAIDRIDYYLAHPAERVAIAQAAYRRVRLDYDHDRNFAALIHWGLGLKAADKRAPDGCR